MPDPLHLLLQHCELVVHDAFFGRHAGAHAGLDEQFESAQSKKLSQSLSSPSVQDVSVGSQAGGGPQSSAQLKLFSTPPHWRSPQHDADCGVLLQSSAPCVHRESAQVTGFWPVLPLPQQ
jgi:hypothetical protein